MAYLLDSDVFIQAQNMHYGFNVFPGFWAWLDQTYANGKLLSIKDVRNELMALEDDLSKWVKPRSKMFVDRNDSATYESLKLLSSWAETNYERAAQSEFFGAADFFLVGYAHAHNHTVVRMKFLRRVSGSKSPSHARRWRSNASRLSKC